MLLSIKKIYFYLIDFDRMIHKSEIELANTVDFGSSFVGPEVNFHNYSFSNDIYSLVKVIENIIIKYKPTKINNMRELQTIGEKCTNKDPNLRPSIIDLLFEFYSIYKTKIKLNFVNSEPLNIFNSAKYGSKLIAEKEYKLFFFTTLSAVLNDPI